MKMRNSRSMVKNEPQLYHLTCMNRMVGVIFAFFSALKTMWLIKQFYRFGVTGVILETRK